MLAVNIRQIFSTTSGRWICRSATRNRGSGSAIDASRGQSFAVNGFDQNSRDLLRKSAMFARGATA